MTSLDKEDVSRALEAKTCYFLGSCKNFIHTLVCHISIGTVGATCLQHLSEYEKGGFIALTTEELEIIQILAD